MPDYPILRVLERHGGWISLLVALVPVAISIWFVAMGAGQWWIAAGLGGGGVIYVLAKSYVELIRVMIDMLLPK